MNNYPPGFNGLPGEDDEEKEYIFEVYGEIVIRAYSEEEAEKNLKDNLSYAFLEAYNDGTLKVE